MRGEHSAPKFDTSRPRELPRYFEDLERLMSRVPINIEADKKKQAVHYVDFDTEQLWRSIPDFDDNTKTYNDYKDAILEHYPDAAGDFLYSIRDMDLLIGERQRLGINSVKDLSDFHLPFLSITTWLIRKNQLSTLEQDRAYTRAFQAQLISPIIAQLRFQIPGHHPNIPYRVADVYSTARSVLQGMPAQSFTTQAQPIVSPAVPADTQVKVETLAPFMAEFTKTIIEALKGSNLSQRQIERIIECIMCGGKHGVFSCPIVEEFIKAGKCRRNHENKVVLPNGSFVPRNVPGRWLADRIDEWHRQNPNQQGTTSTMIHTIESRVGQETSKPLVPYQPLTTTYTLSGDERIAIMKAEIYNIEKAKEIAVVKTRAQQKGKASADNSDNQQARLPVPRLEEVEDEEAPPRHSTVSTSNSQLNRPEPVVPSRSPTVSIPNIQPTVPEHPYRNAKDAAYAPPVNRNVAAQDKYNPGKRPEPAYKTLPPVHDPAIAANVYKRSMDIPITITYRELLSMSPEVRAQYRDSTTTRRMPFNNGNAVQNYLDMEIGEYDNQQLLTTIAETVSTFAVKNTLPDGALVMPDPIEKYYSTLAPGETPDPDRLIVAIESGAVRTILAFIDNKRQKECILDPGCQIVAMSETSCHELGLAYDPSIILNMVSANGNINQSLGLARNVAFQVGSITFYLQVHIIQSPAYDVLLGRPFDILTESVVRNFANQDQTITISDPNSGRRVTVPTLNRTIQHCHHTPEEKDF
jgi:hypothetical protein